jgi:DNA invertase Pin-like site-specific DNA recombinase
MKVLHHCDTRNCINPEHLFLGTQADNIADMDAKGRRYRGSINVGSRNGGAKLGEDEVLEIRRLVSAGTTYGDLARRFGVSLTAISKVVLRKKWKHI